MPKTIEAKLLLGWMGQHEAIDALNSCVFDPPYTKKRAIALWKDYRDKVLALPPRNTLVAEAIDLTEAEKVAIGTHGKNLQGNPMAQFFLRVAKVAPENLVARQYYVTVDRAAQYAELMKDEQTRINHFLGFGMQFAGTLPPPRGLGKLLKVDLPHAEFVPLAIPGGFTFRERDRYVTGADLNGGRMMLWSGYHRTYAIELLRQAGGDAAGAAPLLTVMTGMPDVQGFLASRTAVRDCVLGERPALLRDFLDPDLCVTVNLRKTRAEGRIELYRPTRMRAGVFLVPDES
jgi:hypothetical protein